MTKPSRWNRASGSWPLVSALGLGLAVLGVWGNSSASAADPARSPDPKPLRAPAKSLQRWQAMRFGLFIHWGPVSLRGTEIGWSRGAQVPTAEYDQLYRQFNPERFDANAWMATAKAAGMKYVVFTSKHHDGFANWATQQTDYNIMHSPFGRDIVKELAAACRRQGLMFGLYHSICDWYHPDYPLGSPGGRTAKPAPNMDRYQTFLKNQLAELLTGYGPLGVMWFDGEWEAPWTVERSLDLARHVRTLQPRILINNRVGKGREDMAGMTRAGLGNPGDFATPEQQVGRFNREEPWESCITICQQWAWKPADRLKSLKECIDTLVTCAGGDGNLLLNVGPMPTGEIEPRQVERLREIGAWLRDHGTAIYDTRGGPFLPGPWGVSTCRGRTVFVHILKWPSETIRLPGLNRRIVKASLLDGGTVSIAQGDGGLEITVPAASRRELDTVVALRLDGPAFDAQVR